MSSIENNVNATALLHSDPVAKLVILGEEASYNNDETGAAIIKSAVRYAFAEAGLEEPRVASKLAKKATITQGLSEIVVCKNPFI